MHACIDVAGGVHHMKPIYTINKLHTGEDHNLQVAISIYGNLHLAVHYAGTGNRDQERGSFHRMIDEGRFHPIPTGL